MWSSHPDPEVLHIGAMMLALIVVLGLVFLDAFWED
jgi:hypothetical protein